MDKEMIERCIDDATKLIEGYNMIGVKTPIKEVVITVITAMREPTEKMVAGAMYESSSANTWRAMIDAITGGE